MISLYLYSPIGNFFFHKTVCTDCLTKKPIDLTLLSKEFLMEFLAEQQNFFGNKRDSIFGTVARLCDVCFLGKRFTKLESLFLSRSPTHGLCVMIRY